MRESKPDWDDLSNYVVHFTKEAPGSADQLIAILQSGMIEARNRYGAALYDERAPKVVCLTETPIHKLSRILARRGPYGIGFHKRFAIGLGGGPVLYAYGPQKEAIRDLIRNASDGNPIWRLSAFFSPVADNYEFEWEREWRVVGDIEFSVSDFDFLIMPEAEHERFLDWARKEIAAKTMPHYACPIIDARWPKERIDKALRVQ